MRKGVCFCLVTLMCVMILILYGAYEYYLYEAIILNFLTIFVFFVKMICAAIAMGWSRKRKKQIHWFWDFCLTSIFVKTDKLDETNRKIYFIFSLCLNNWTIFSIGTLVFIDFYIHYYEGFFVIFQKSLKHFFSEEFYNYFHLIFFSFLRFKIQG